MRVLLATDGSDQARSTADLLYRLLPPDSQVTLLSVFDDSGLPSDEWAPGALAKLHDALRGETDRLLAREARRLEEAGHAVEVVSRQGDAGDEITTAARELDADLVALGSRGRSRFKELLVGSVSQRVVRHSPCSVLLGRPLPLVEPGAEAAAALKIVLAVDGSSESRVAARMLACFARHQALDIDCLRVLPEERDWGVDLARHMTEVQRRDKQEAVQLLRQTCAMLQTSGASASNHLLFGEDPAEGIIEHAREAKAHLLAVGRRGMSKVDRFLLGSVSHKLIHHAPCPLLLVKGEVAGKTD